MTILEEQLGHSMTVKEVADYMKIDSSTVRKYYQELGGVRFGKVYRFFERRIHDAIQAQGEMACPSQVERSDQAQVFPDKKGSNRMGGRTKEKIQKIDEVRDKFKLLA